MSSEECVRDVGWVLQTGPCLMNVLSASVCGKIFEVKKIKKPSQSEKVGQPGEFICATSFFHQIQRG